MTNQDFTRLAYTKSPKTSRRTTFQDELQAAVSSRASKAKTDYYSDDFNEEEDDFLNQLLKSRKQKSSAFKAGKGKAKINDFDISDNEDKHGRRKRVSFLKTQRIHSSSEASEPHEHDQLDSSISQHNDYNNSFSSQHSTNINEDKNSEVESADSHVTRESTSISLSYQTSGDTLLDMPLPLPSDNSVIETPGPEEKSNLLLGESALTPQSSVVDLKHVSSADSATEREPPRPKPRQRTLGLTLHAVEKIAEDTESQDLSRPQTSSVSIPLSTDASSNIAIRSCSPEWTEGDGAVSRSFSEQSQHLTKSTADSESRDGFISDGSQYQEGRYSTSFEDLNQNSGDQSDALCHGHGKSLDTGTLSSNSKTTQRSQSACSRKVESKYLGSLKVLDRKVSLQESQPPAADSLRAAIYQEWLQKKKEKSRENMQLRRKEEMLKEKKKMDEEAKKEHALASYEAWKAKKAESLRLKAKEKQDMIQKEQRAIEEKEEKRQSAKEVFEKWKHEHDCTLKQKYIKQKAAECKLKLKKQDEEEERKRESKSAFSHWYEKKNDALHERVTTERKEGINKEEEERYMKEERDKMALDMYENWLVCRIISETNT
ncbi:uncharacterized protein V6R79_016758 [Siganus canaliculatus]